MKSGTFFTNEVITAEPCTAIGEIVRLFEEHNVGAVIIVEQHRPVGIVTDRDVALALGAREIELETRVQKIMTCPIATVGQHDGIFKATKRMQETGARRLPVVDEVGRVVGIVTADDLLPLLVRELCNVTEAMRPATVAV